MAKVGDHSCLPETALRPDEVNKERAHQLLEIQV